MKFLHTISLLAGLVIAAPAGAQVNVVFGTTWDGPTNTLQGILDARYGAGNISVTNDYIGKTVVQPDPFVWSGLSFNSLLVREVAGNANSNVVGWYLDVGTAPVIDGVSDGVVFNGPQGAGAVAMVTLGPGNTAFGFYMNPNGPGAATNAPEPEKFFTNRLYNDIGPNGSGAVHTPADGDVQALIFDVSAWTQPNTWVVCFEDLDSGPNPTPCCSQTDNDFNDFVFEHTEAFAKNAVARPGIAWLLPFFKPYHGLIAQSTALALIVSGLEMVIPVFTQVIVDRVLVERDTGLLHVLIAAMGAVIAFTLAATLIQRYLLSWMAVRVDSATLDFLTRRLLALPMSYFNTRRTGDIQRRLAGIWQVREFLVEHGVAALTAVAQLLAALALMTVYSPTLTLVFFATVPVLVLLMRVSGHWFRPLYAEMEEAYGKYQSFQIDAIRGIETVKSLGAEHNFRDLMLRQFNSVAKSRFKADFSLMTYEGVVHSVTLVTVLLFLLVGAGQVMDGKMSIGALVAFNALVALANDPMLTLVSLWDNMQQVSVYLNRLDDIFQQEPEQGHDRSRLIPVKSLEGRIAFRGLGFRYGGAESPPILDDITFEVPPGTMVAVVGRSGSGKTTLIKILAGLLEPTAGTILYDGIDLKTLNYRDLRRKIGFVLQENHLFDDTIARNIAFGEEEPNIDQVMWAAQVANAREFIERLPLGYDTRIGESGIGLSGGQRQRVAIARAVCHKPPVLIFDEATSALDTESERAVKENIDQLLQGRTSFVIAHRLSTVRNADLILVLERGKLAEQGTHDDLMRRQGLYYFLVSQQLEL